MMIAAKMTRVTTLTQCKVDNNINCEQYYSLPLVFQNYLGPVWITKLVIIGWGSKLAQINYSWLASLVMPNSRLLTKKLINILELLLDALELIFR